MPLPSADLPRGDSTTGGTVGAFTPAPPAAAPQPAAGSPIGSAGPRGLRGSDSPAAGQQGEDLEALRARHGDPLPRRLLRRLRRLVGDDDFPDAYERALGGCQVPVATGRRVGVLSTDGGVGRSTLTAALGLILAATRADAVSAVDLGPASGGVAARLPEQVPASSWQQLLADPQNPDQTTTRLHQSLQRAGSSLHLLDRDPDPTSWVAPTAEQIDLLHHVLARAFSVSVLELPPAALPMPAASLTQMHCLVLASGSAWPSVARTVDHLHRLRRRAPEVPILPVISSTRPTTSAERRSAYDALGSASGVAPLLVDHDRHLAPGLPISLDRIGEQRRLQLVEVAAAALSMATLPGPRLAPHPAPQESR